MSKETKLQNLRMKSAFALALAVNRFFEKQGQAVRFGSGKATENGFYYDFETPRPLNTTDLDEIRVIMADELSRPTQSTLRHVSIPQAKEIFKNQPYQLEVIEDYASQCIEGREDCLIPVHQAAEFIDICAAQLGSVNPQADAVQLTTTSAVHWRGKADGVSLQRVYGIAFSSKKDLDKHLWQLEEAERRDHRKLGKELELFHFDETAPGMPYWLPNGNKILNTLISFWREEHEDRGYQEITTPILNGKELWETSGHWDHYRDDMFQVQEGDRTYGLKPMNCPNALVVYNLKPRSHKELPIRYSDCDPLHRNEDSGALHGLMRVREFRQDDAHIFLKEDQIEAEYGRILDICDKFYRIFEMPYSFRIGTRPKDFMGDTESWDKAEAALHRILSKQVGEGNYEIAEGDGAFYGPKVDIVMKDSLDRKWQMGTIQLDFQLPKRFDVNFVDEQGQKQTPVLIHRVIYGSLERFIGILIEHTGGKFPAWLAPTQAEIIPISDRHMDYAQEVAKNLKQVNRQFRVVINETCDRMGAKIRDAQLKKVPYMLVVGDKEATSGEVSVRARNGENLGAMPVRSFAQRLQTEINDKTYG